jgi:hypothetical protein
MELVCFQTVGVTEEILENSIANGRFGILSKNL